MPTTWNIGVDWNRDGFLCRDARPGDALNLLPAPLTHATLSSAGFSGATCAKRREDTRFGRQVYRCVKDQG